MFTRINGLVVDCTRRITRQRAIGELAFRFSFYRSDLSINRKQSIRTAAHGCGVPLIILEASQ